MAKKGSRKRKSSARRKSTATTKSQRATTSKSAPARRGKPQEQKPVWRRTWFLVAAICLLIAVLLALWYFLIYKSNKTEKVMQWSEPPTMQIDPTKKYTATIETEKGDIVVDLYADKAPLTVNNFVFLARQGYYDDTTFHRVISGFMAQAGDPTGTGTGGPGYRFEDEFHPELRHDSEGIVSMANAGANTNGSQFFITYAPQPHLDDLHTVFGKVREGMDVLRSLREVSPSADPAAPVGDRIITISIDEE